MDVLGLITNIDLFPVGITLRIKKVTLWGRYLTQHLAMMLHSFVSLTPRMSAPVSRKHRWVSLPVCRPLAVSKPPNNPNPSFLSITCSVLWAAGHNLT